MYEPKPLHGRACIACGGGFYSKRPWAKRCPPCRVKLRSPGPRPVSSAIPFDLGDDLAQERALAALEGREFDMREFKRTNCPYRERARVPEWRL